MKRSEHCFKLEEKSNGDVFWNGVFIQSLVEKKIEVKNEEYDITLNIQSYFTNTKLFNKSLNDNENETKIDILNKVELYDMKHTKRLKSARMKDALHILPKTITNFSDPLLPAIESIEDSYAKISDNDLKGQVFEKTIIPSNIIDIYISLEVILGLKLSSHIDALTETSNLMDELYKRGEIQIEEQYRNALNNFQT